MENSIKVLKWAVIRVEVMDVLVNHLEAVTVPEVIIRELGIAPYEQATATCEGLCWLTHVIPTERRGMTFYGPRAEKLGSYPFRSVVLYGHHWRPLGEHAPVPQVWDGSSRATAPITEAEFD